ncbi:hypothetical protein AUJ84_02205 [Candidatus Pacearchaeota archaeon CG1_02_32_132]|nr:MAG: hypothetical protein AUJ84_02205 [Candidatus Pacearchaeota archaeon CG1_02_32_132]
MNKAVFFDRDGVINENGACLNRKDKIVILPGVKEALGKIKALVPLLIVISNQPIIARGLSNEEEIKEINNCINEKIDNLIDWFYFCPHHPNADLNKYRVNCECRKPRAGMIFQAAKDYNIDLSNSWFVGDMISDIIAGKSAGCKTILLKSPDNNNLIEGDKSISLDVKPDFYAKEISEVVGYIERND